MVFVMVNNVLIKASGDVVEKEGILDFIRDKARDNYVVVICGAGTKIGEVLRRKGYDTKFDFHGRITETFEERVIVRNVLEREQKKLQDGLVGTGANVVIPIIEMASILCHINGDMYVKAGYLGFDEIYVFTLNDRVEGKKKIFEGFDKVEIVGV